jgi:hypothetical protein
MDADATGDADADADSSGNGGSSSNALAVQDQHEQEQDTVDLTVNTDEGTMEVDAEEELDEIEAVQLKVSVTIYNSTHISQHTRLACYAVSVTALQQLKTVFSGRSTTDSYKSKRAYFCS